MTLTAIIIILISATTHAGWNLLGKRAKPTAAFFMAANSAGFLCLTPALLLYSEFIDLFPKEVWLLVIGAGLFQGCYYWALARAYQAGDMSIAYPLARSSPVIVVAAITLMMGQGDQVSVQAVWGILLVVTGALVLPMRHFRDFRISNYLNISCLFALGAAFSTAGYSIIDDSALHYVRESNSQGMGIYLGTAVYAFFEGLSATVWMALSLLSNTSGRQSITDVLQRQKGTIILTGIGIYFTYTLVLISMAFVDNISYVVAFRQISIPIGVIMGVFLLKEGRYQPKFLGVMVMFTGLVMVGTG
ncbi:MAG: EamA family transporter [Gammaproteobacteria bacterium]|nr:EamA family transporter [Gammaproteobacteria bacterium]